MRKSRVYSQTFLKILVLLCAAYSTLILLISLFKFQFIHNASVYFIRLYVKDTQKLPNSAGCIANTKYMLTFSHWFTHWHGCYSITLECLESWVESQLSLFRRNQKQRKWECAWCVRHGNLGRTESRKEALISISKF